MADLGKRWERRWQMHEDRKGILDGVVEKTFTLRRISPSGSTPEVFAFDHEATDQGNDPFKDTTFTLSGKSLPSAPLRKLGSWKESERRNYDKVIDELFTDPSPNMQQLKGVKMYEGKPEPLALFLLPQAIDKFDNQTVFVDLIYMTCKREIGTEQDGTAHGNPR